MALKPGLRLALGVTLKPGLRLALGVAFERSIGISLEGSLRLPVRIFVEARTLVAARKSTLMPWLKARLFRAELDLQIVRYVAPGRAAIGTAQGQKQGCDGFRIVPTVSHQLLAQGQESGRWWCGQLWEKLCGDFFFALCEHCLTSRHGKLGQRALREALDQAEPTFFARCDEQQRVSSASGPSSSANPMDVGFQIHREIEVDDVADVIDVEPTRRHIRRNHHSQFLGAHPFEHGRSLGLRQIAV